MKRVLYIVLFGFIGLLFVFAVQALVISAINHGAYQYESGSDEQGEHNLKTLLVGAPIFIVLWGWVGAKVVRDWRLCGGAIAGILVGTLLCFGVPGLKGPCADIFNFSGNVVGLVVWAITSVLFALAGLFLTNKILRGQKDEPLVSR
jgi:hypothetical protein